MSQTAHSNSVDKERLFALLPLLCYPDRTLPAGGDRYDQGKASAAMTMATINLLLGIVSICFILGVVLGALVYIVAGIRGQGFLRRWNLFVTLLLAAIAWGSLITIGQDFARAGDARLRSLPADAPSVFVVVFWTLISAAILVASANCFRGLLRPSAPTAR